MGLGNTMIFGFDIFGAGLFCSKNISSINIAISAFYGGGVFVVGV